MGYITKYNLRVTTPISNELEEEIVKEISTISGYGEDISFNFDEFFEESIKWYDHEKDMIEVSKKYPDLIFNLNGIGEDSDDIWIAYFKDGHSEYCRARIVYDLDVTSFLAKIRDKKIDNILK